MFKLHRIISVFRQKQYTEDKITISSLKNISENKVLKWTESLAGITQKRAVKALFLLSPLKKMKLVFIEKSKEEKIIHLER